jgi:hypothetical protein
MFDPEKQEWQKYWEGRESTQKTLENYFRDMTNDLRSPIAILHAQAAGISLLVEKTKRGDASFEALEKQIEKLVDWSSHVIDLYNDVNSFAVEWLNQPQNSQNQNE